MTRPPGEQPADRGAQPTDPGPEPHDESGLELARSIARSLARGPRRRRASSSDGRPGPGRRTEGRSAPQSSGAHPDDRDPQLLDATIGRLVAEQGWDADVRVHGVFSRWDAVVGREVAQHVRPVGYAREDGRLTVQTDSTAWATQMRLLAATVVRRLNETLGDGTVLVIDVRGPNVPSWKRGRLSARDGRGPRDTYG